MGVPLGVPGPEALGTAFAVFVGAGFLAFTSVFSVWLLDAVYELDEARETRARLAVAENGCGSGGTCTTSWGATSR